QSNFADLDAIVQAINGRFPNGEVVASRNNSPALLGNFVSAYMAYHVAWYRDWSQANLDASESCSKAGHTHVGIQLQHAVADAQTAVGIQLSKVADELP